MIYLNLMLNLALSTSLDGRIVLMNPAAETLTGWTGAQAEGKPLAVVLQVLDAQTHERISMRDAITGEGRLTIETENVVLDETYCTGHAGYVPGEYMLLAVSDTGAGIDKEVLGHLFEPFFTTKTMGKGTGLGLATVYGIVTQNNGFIYETASRAAERLSRSICPASGPYQRTEPSVRSLSPLKVAKPSFWWKMRKAFWN